ncbi:MAG: elongation factor G [Candidatus Delongbacteria bacterium]|nr:elongation factor G [Candidatus Delongbacteria bacterium]MCG2760018.1 elongation factor G [Candidatus Delongbacteria bacterium]
MRAYHAKDVRNIAIVGHNSVGKTILAEGIAFYTGKITRMGSIVDGTTLSDYSVNEIEKKYSIRSSLIAIDNKDVKYNIIDCPGYADFIGETYGAVKVADSVLVTVSAASTQGTEVGTEMGFEISHHSKKPTAFFINKCDYENADYDKVIQDLQKTFSSSVTEVQFPIGKGETFHGIVDIFDMKMYCMENGKPVAKEIPAEAKSKAEEIKTALVENIAGSDEVLMEKYFEAGELTPDEFNNGFKKAFSEGSIFPVFCGSAIKGIGIHSLMDKFDTIFLSPTDVKTVAVEKGNEIEISTDETKPFSAFVFKTVAEAHVGDLTFFKVLTGKLTPGTDLKNGEKVERVGQINIVMGKTRHEIPEICAGDIGTVVKLKYTKTNDTITDKSLNYTIKPMDIPKPLMWEAVRTRDKKDDAKIGQALLSLSNEDPTFGYSIDPELHQTIIHGQGTKHIETMIEKLKERFSIEIDVIEPRVPYRETITGKAEGSYRHKKQSGGKGQFGEVHMKVRPKGRGEGYNFVNSITGGSIPARFIPAVEKGVNETLVVGVISGSLVVDLEAELFYGKFHDVDSSEMAFKIASRMCFKDLFKKANPILLEPIYTITVSVPEEYTGDVMGDISSKRGRPEGMESKGGKQFITAKVPLSELYRYATTLKTMTQGKGSFELDFDHYEVVPYEVQQKIVEKYEASKGHEEEE